MSDSNRASPSGRATRSSARASTSLGHSASIPDADEGSYRLNPSFRKFMGIVRPVGLAAAAWQIARDYFRPSGLNDDAEYEVWQDDEMVAGCSGPRRRAIAEAVHYATVYQTDERPCVIQEVTRREIGPDEAHTLLAEGAETDAPKGS